MKRRVKKNIITNLIRLISLLIGLSIISFYLVNLSPVDPIQAYVGAGVAVSPDQRENISQTWGLNQRPIERLKSWASALIKGDFGSSLIYRRPVMGIIKERFGVSLRLMATAWILSGLIGYCLGIIMGVFRERLPDKLIKSICLILLSTPGFWIGLLLLMTFSIYLGWFPLGLSIPAGEMSQKVGLLTKIHHMALPALTLCLGSFGEIALHTREKTNSVLESDYVLFARARGKNTWQIIKDHAIRNTLIPLVTLQFASFGELFAGSILVEQIFSYPGLGQALIEAGLRGDIPLLLGITIISGLFIFTGNTIANIIYGFIDPEIREASL